MQYALPEWNKNDATLPAEKAEKLAHYFQAGCEKQKEAYEYLSILGERQFEKIADLVAELLSRNGVDDISNLTADDAVCIRNYALGKSIGSSNGLCCAKGLSTKSESGGRRRSEDVSAIFL